MTLKRGAGCCAGDLRIEGERAQRAGVFRLWSTLDTADGMTTGPLQASLTESIFIDSAG